MWPIAGSLISAFVGFIAPLVFRIEDPLIAGTVGGLLGFGVFLQCLRWDDG